MTPSLLPRRLDIVEVCQEASERAGIEFRAGYALTTARRSIELLQLDWANRGLNLWTLDRIDVPLLKDQPDYELPLDTIDVLDCALRDWDHQGSTSPYQWNDRPLARIPLGDWPGLTGKHTPGTPSSYIVERTEPMKLHPWPIPDRDGTLVAWRLRYMQRLAPGGSSVIDAPLRFLPAMISGLAYYLALKSKGESFQRVSMLQAMYEADFDLASQEDRDRSSVFFVPDGGGY